MGFVIWYAVQLSSQGAPIVRVSNDVFKGEFVLDAEITLEMAAGRTADTFEASLTNLPADVAKGLKAAHTSRLPEPRLEAKIFLGYFDEPATTLMLTPVMHGVVTSVQTSVSDGGMLVTKVKGLELGGYKLLSHCVDDNKPGNRNLEEFVDKLAKKAGVSVKKPTGLTPVEDYTLRAKNGFEALNRVATLAEKPLVVRDNTIFIGDAVGSEEFGELRQDTNIVSLERRQEEEADPEFCRRPSDPTAERTTSRTELDLQVLGHPDLRVGQGVKLDLEDSADALQGTTRINHLRHRFSTRSGYTCDVTLIAAESGQLARSSSRGSHRIAQRVQDVAERATGERGAIDVGEVASYDAGKDKHLATLNYGQSPARGSIAPSIEEPVNEQPKLTKKPIVSPFAFQQCGLVVPVYPKMRALLAHNDGLTNDALVAGFVWPENPKAERPPNQAGDYWLCLPTGLDGNGLPTGKSVDDLTDASGFRAINVKGLKINIGDKLLKGLGQRPAPPTNESIEIEHTSGTKIRIAPDGKVEITAANKDVAISAGSGKVTISASAVEVS